MKILFMGTPDFAVPSLRALYGSGEEIVGVVTQPDKPRGRGYVLTPPPVKTYAAAHGLPVFQPARLRDGSFDDTLKALEPEKFCRRTSWRRQSTVASTSTARCSRHCAAPRPCREQS